MSIELAASQRALNEPAPLSLDDAGLEPDHVTTAFVGVELGSLGAARDDSVSAHDLPAGCADVRRLVSSLRAAQSGGIDFVSLDSSFALRSDSQANEALLDAARGASRLAKYSTAGVFAQVPPAPKVINMAIDLLASQKDGWAGLTFGLNDNSDFDGIARSAREARGAGIKVCVIVTNPEMVHSRADLVASIADVVRLRCTDPHVAREARFALRSAAARRGRELLVFAELGVVISANAQAAQERANLIMDMTGEELFPGIAASLGTVYDVADTIETWVGFGAVDGIVLVPASLPCDLASILKGVLPLLEARNAER